MGTEKKSQASGTHPDPAAQAHTRNQSAGQDGHGEGADKRLEMTLARAEAMLALLTAWLANIQKLFQLELDRTLTAGKRLVLLQLMLVPLGTALLVSLCGGMGLVAYYFSQSVYFGFLVFLLLQVVIFIGAVIYQKKLRPLLGFAETKRQIKEALNDVAETIK
ncbi:MULTISPECIES: hypothetical protein [unclassified Microbulbifer]|uniref:Phage holin family protein n=1 Tax=Microbulbifer spongiae TaxID=2944933 RepID=A0ABY9ECH8_9GAMM|nr:MULTISPECIES: hypothetical protein [unclassified Microbulbifer]MDP5209402.1 hypothetical protein [Microbulbifer sp. 2205BS26-8]WKD49204.1 hypothetical protein M8T91_15070 [Microbulbifer sp. MI-G]